MPDLHHETCLTSPDMTTRLAKKLGQTMQVGDVILLEGDIGAGKSHFSRALIRSLLTYDEDIPSPTFTLVQIYDGEVCEIWHSDLYRLSSPDEVVELGLIDAFQDAICLVEWPDRLAELRPVSALTLRFTMTDNPGERTLTVSATDPKWRAKLEGLLDV